MFKIIIKNVFHNQIAKLFNDTNYKAKRAIENEQNKIRIKEEKKIKIKSKYRLELS